MTSLQDALASLNAGDLGEAERLSNLALEDAVARPDALHILGLTALARGEEGIALRRIREAVAADPENLDRRLDLGQMELEAGDVERAMATFEALAELTSAAVVYLALGNAYVRAERYKDAITACERAVEAAPDAAQCWNDLAAAYLASGEAAAAAEGYRQAARLAPEEPELHFNLGIAELRACAHERAKTAFDDCLTRAPEHMKALVHLGIALKALRQPERALDVQERALALAPDDADAEWNLALTKISLGDYAAGWSHYEARTRLPGYPDLPGMAWDGSTSPSATLVLHSEQGLGDTFMLLRFIAGARARVRRVVLTVPRRLVRIVADGFQGADEVLANDDGPHTWPAETLHARLPSLPHLLHVGGDFAVDDAYLRADAERRARVTKRLEGTGLRVGLAWQGSPGYRADKTRSIPLADLAPFAQVPGARFFSLQKHVGTEQLASLPVDFHVDDLASTLDTEGDAFVDTAAALCELDLLITSDSAIAHLAGALGVETWLLLSYAPDFRWGFEGTESAWYPHMRLFRQEAAGDWRAVAQEVAEALRARPGDAA